MMISAAAYQADGASSPTWQTRSRRPRSRRASRRRSGGPGDPGVRGPGRDQRQTGKPCRGLPCGLRGDLPARPGAGCGSPRPGRGGDGSAGESSEDVVDAEVVDESRPEPDDRAEQVAPAGRAHLPRRKRVGSKRARPCPTLVVSPGWRWEPAAAAEPTDGADTESGGRAILEGDVAELLAAVAKRDEYLGARTAHTGGLRESPRHRRTRFRGRTGARRQAGARSCCRHSTTSTARLGGRRGGGPAARGRAAGALRLAAALGRVGIDPSLPVELCRPHNTRRCPARVEGAERGSSPRCYQPGYRLNGTIIRPARVVVAA